jgi:hypothetical protein
VAACDAPASRFDLIYVDGRAVAAAGDTVSAVTRPADQGFLVYDRRTKLVDTLGQNDLTSPFHIQEADGRWYVSDVREGRASVAIFSANGILEERVDLDTVASAPHQFAVLPDGRIVVEAADDQLVTLRPGEEARTLAITDRSDRSGLIVAASGGVLHAIPGQSITLYNANGNLRWRLPWPWHEGAFVADMAVDARGRYHVIAGEEGRSTFVVFTLSPTTGEILRWSVPGTQATFVVDRLGQIEPDTAGRWIGG